MIYKPLPYLLLDDLKGHLYAAGHDAILMPLSVIEGIQKTLDQVWAGRMRDNALSAPFL